MCIQNYINPSQYLSCASNCERDRDRPATSVILNYIQKRGGHSFGHDSGTRLSHKEDFSGVFLRIVKRSISNTLSNVDEIHMPYIFQSVISYRPKVSDTKYNSQFFTSEKVNNFFNWKFREKKPTKLRKSFPSAWLFALALICRFICMVILDTTKWWKQFCNDWVQNIKLHKKSLTLFLLKSLTFQFFNFNLF